MASSQIELLASYGDKTVSKTRFVAYVPVKQSVAENTTQGKLVFHEGQPAVSSDLLYTHDLASQLYGASAAGSQIYVYMVPSKLFVGNSVFTSAFLDLKFKQVTGSPMRYAGARKQLTMYGLSDTESERSRLEAALRQNTPLDHMPERTVETENLLGSFRTGGSLSTIVTELKVALTSLDAEQFIKLVKSFYESFTLADASFQSIASGVVSELMLATVESEVICRVRMLRWQGLKLLGYKIMEGPSVAELPSPSSDVEMHTRLSDYTRMLNSSSIFNGELDWLKTYALSELNKIKVELEGAALNSLSD